MKKALLIFLMLVIPWQAFASMERNFAHVSGSGSKHGLEFVSKHLAEHDAHVLHHHDDDGDADSSNTHVDQSDKSIQHLADYEHSGSVNSLLPAFSSSSPSVVMRFAPTVWPDTFFTRTIPPLLRPPRLPA